MKFKGIQTILTFISLQLMVSSSPIFESDKNSKSFSTEVVDDIIYIKDEISEEFSKITNSISGAFGYYYNFLIYIYIFFLFFFLFF